MDHYGASSIDFPPVPMPTPKYSNYICGSFAYFYSARTSILYNTVTIYTAAIAQPTKEGLMTPRK